MSLSETPLVMEKPQTQGLQLVCKCQKLIRMADRSEHGWTTVEEYLEDELLVNSDEKRRMQKVEFRAARKLKANNYKKRMLACCRRDLGWSH